MQRPVQMLAVPTLQPPQALLLYQQGYNLYLIRAATLVWEPPTLSGWHVVAAVVGLLALLLGALFLLFVAGLIMTGQPLFY
jgi:hypothetical protein